MAAGATGGQDLRLSLDVVQPWEGSHLPDPGPSRTGTFEVLSGVGDAAVVNTEAGMAAVQQCRVLLWVIHDPSGPLDPHGALITVTRQAASRLPSCGEAAAPGAGARSLAPLWPGFDPCSLLAEGEVAAAVGVPIEGGGQYGECWFIGDTPQGVIPVTLGVEAIAPWIEDPFAGPSLRRIAAPEGLAIASEDAGNYWVQAGRCVLYLHGSIEPGFLSEAELLSLAVLAAGRLEKFSGCGSE